jgi:hypothetical protein
MKRIVFTILISMMVAAPAYAKSFKNEAEYQKEWCAKHNGEIDYKVSDNTKVDCITDTHAVEFDFGKKWNQAIRKSTRQSLNTGKTPGIVLILEQSKDKKYLKKLREINGNRRLGIKIWTVGIDADLPCDIKGDISNNGEKIYYHLGQQMYDATVVNPKYGETWFCSYEEAEAAGWKPSKR